MADGGILAFHISNGYVDLHPVLGNLAEEAGITAVFRDHERLTEAEVQAGGFPSHWVAMARDPGDLGPLLDDPRWHRLVDDPARPVWTDDYSNILGVFKWS